MPPRSAAPGIGDDTAAAAAPSAPQPGRGGLLADIRGGAKLKKVSDSEKRDRSAAAVPGSEAASAPSAATSGGGGDAAQGGLAGALASALAARKSKVSHSGKFIPGERETLEGFCANYFVQMMRRMMMIGRDDQIVEDSRCSGNEVAFKTPLGLGTSPTCTRLVLARPTLKSDPVKRIHLLLPLPLPSARVVYSVAK